MKKLIAQHVRYEMNMFKFKVFQTADALSLLLSAVNAALSDV